MSILLLGSTGAFGTAIVKVCEERNIKYVGLTHNNFEITKPTDLERVVKKYSPSVIINSVVLMGINPCENNPRKAFGINSVAVSDLAKICREKDIILVQPSSHAVFDGTKDTPYTEKDVPCPINIYGTSKLSAELFAENICEKHYVVRFPTMFGPRKNKNLGFVDKMIELMKKGKKLKVAYDKIDSPTYTLDAAKEVMNIIEKSLPYGIYHIANSGKASYYDLIKQVGKLINSNSEILKAKDVDFPSLAPKPLKTSMKSTKLPKIRNWENALEDYISSLQ